MYLHKRGLAAPKASTFLLTVTLLLVSLHGIESIVKPQTQSQAQQSQQQRSDDVSLQQQQQQNSNSQNANFNNHQAASASAQASGTSSASSQQLASQQSPSPAQSGSRGSSSSIPSMNSYAPSAANANQKSTSAYMDGMATAASNPEQSYQAAAQSVNMALASSGIFGPNSYAPQQPQQQQQAAAAGQASQSNLNPLHYFYYPAKDSSQNVAPNSASPSANKQQDMMANSASNNYQSMASYPSYADQYNSYATPDAAASNQDPSYLPQPMDQQSQPNQMYNQAGQQAQSSQQPMNSANGQAQQYANSDLSAYNSNQSPPSSVSFQANGPSSNGPQQPQQNSLPAVNQNNDYMNSHMGGHQSQQSGAPSQAQSSYQNNLLNQLASGGDLSTSNFGNNGAGLSSIASYMPPNSQPVNGQQQPGHQHDLFPSGLLGSQFNSAASQLSPAAIAPPNQQQAQQQAQQSTNSLFSNSLFGKDSQMQQQQQQQNNLFGGGINGAHNYLNSFLTPQQYQQLTGQQLTAMASEQSPFLTGQMQQQQPAMSSQASSANPIAAASGHSKRFGLSSFIMPMLALAGLSLLIPTVSNLGPIVGRKKRSIVEEKESTSNRQQQIQHDSMNGAHQILKENSIGEYLERIERYYSIYRNAVESDDCLNKLICEFGDAVKDVTGKGAVMSVLERVVPNWMTGKMHVFKEAALSSGSHGKEKCKKYVCHNGRQQK